MIANIVRYTAALAALIVTASFVLFAAVELRESSNGQIEKLDGTTAPRSLETAIQRPNPDRATEQVRDANHSVIREAIDDANDVLVSPFTGFTEFDSVWGQRFVVLLLGLALYLGGGLWLANFFPKQGNRAGDWREATS